MRQSFESLKEEFLNSSPDNPERKQILSRLAKSAHTFKQHMYVFYKFGIKTEEGKTALANMARLAHGFYEWRRVYFAAPINSHLGEAAYQQILKLRKKRKLVRQ
ncbi:MAG: hypothetical protein PHI53_02405 [Candidatus Pacebacteria bacterium]|nr:hypothetical protein [Candidatus Paceibacterota bacterium]